MLTRTGANKILQRIWETGGLTPDMEEDIQKLRDELDEREGVLKKYGEVYDSEDRDEYEYKEREIKYDEDYKAKYDDLKTRYMNRFFGTSEVREEYNRVENSQEEDVKEDGEPTTFDELLAKSDEEEK